MSRPLWLLSRQACNKLNGFQRDSELDACVRIVPCPGIRLLGLTGSCCDAGLSVKWEFRARALLREYPCRRWWGTHRAESGLAGANLVWDL
jgi:hypothetical protein